MRRIIVISFSTDDVVASTKSMTSLLDMENAPKEIHVSIWNGDSIEGDPADTFVLSKPTH